MADFFQTIVIISLIPVFTMITGAMITIYAKPNGNANSLILHFAAGVVFSVVSVELLPDILRLHKPPYVITGFVIGLALMLLVTMFLEVPEEKQIITIKGRLPFVLLIAIGVDILIDGLLVGIGFSAGVKEGILLVLALAIELLSLGMAIASALSKIKLNNQKTILIIGILSAMFLATTIIGAALLHNLSDTEMEVVLSFGLAALLYLITEKLLTEAHKEKETIWHTSTFFGGFLLFLILGMYV